MVITTELPALQSTVVGLMVKLSTEASVLGGGGSGVFCVGVGVGVGVGVAVAVGVVVGVADGEGVAVDVGTTVPPESRVRSTISTMSTASRSAPPIEARMM